MWNSIYSNSRVTFENNIILDGIDAPQRCNSCIFRNNVFVGISLSENKGSNTLIDNKFVENATDIFVDFEKGDYHLKDDCVGKNAGTDSTDVGIYGTKMPFKENKLPANPHIRLRAVATETNAMGKLPIDMSIEAQDY